MINDRAQTNKMIPFDIIPHKRDKKAAEGYKLRRWMLRKHKNEIMKGIQDMLLEGILYGRGRPKVKWDDTRTDNKSIRQTNNTTP